MYEQARDEMLEEFGRVAEDRGYRPGHKWPWSLEKLLADLGAVASIDSSVGGKGSKPEWTVGIRRLVMILREERASLRRAKDLDMRREIESKNAAGGRK